MSGARRGKDLSDQQERFVKEYLVDLNGAQAVIRAGYVTKHPDVRASALLDNPAVKRRIENTIAQRHKRLDVRADKVVLELGRIGLADPLGIFDAKTGGLKDMAEIPEDLRRCIASIEVEELFEGNGKDREMIGYVKKVKFWDKPKALEILARYFKILVDGPGALTQNNVQQNVFVNLDFTKMSELEIEHTLALLKHAQPAPATPDVGSGAAPLDDPSGSGAPPA